METKSKKVLLIGLILLTMVFFSCINVFANSTSYTSTLRMSANSSATGATREYVERNHKISIYPKELEDGATRITIDLHKKGIFSDNVVSTSTVYIDQVNKTYTCGMGNHDTGKFYYHFSSFGNSPTGSIYADPVTMTSYD